ncbi:MAG: DUF3667 domain-containing protein [Hyphomonadaceae bacterium]|nr:DUF3667 domain-containing protein [Hyphomonadaceae bacterium]
MGTEIEAAGAAVTAGLVTSAIERPETRKQAHGPCINCGAELTGNYCAKCGQPAHVHRKLGHMAAEFLHNLFHLDTRAWRTLPLLLFRPGQLTHDYIHGKRARYISPLAMFLLSVFAMILVFEAVGGSRIGVPGGEAEMEDLATGVAELERELVEAQAKVTELESSGAETGDINEARGDVRDTEGALRGLRAALEAIKQNTAKEAGASGAAPPASADGPALESGLKLDSDVSVYDEIRSAGEREGWNADTGWPALDRKIEENLRNPELAVYKVQNAADNFAFLLVPISLPFVWLMFLWRRGVTLFDHVVYILYSLSFVSLLLIGIALLGLIPGAMGIVLTPLLLAALVHSFFHLKGGYGLGWFSAMWRLPVQLIFSAIALTIFLVAILILGLAG